MKHYKIVLEVEFDAENPLVAAKELERRCKEDDDRYIYVVQDDQSGEIVSVDLTEDDEDAVLPNPNPVPLITVKENDLVTCEGCGEVIPETDLYCNNCGDENF